MTMSLTKTALLTGPTVLWIYVRFFGIFRQRYRSIWHHTVTGGARMIVHMTSGLFLLVAIPLVALLMIPPASRPKSLAHGIVAQHQDEFLVAVGLFLLAVNGSTVFLVPHPERHKEYSSILSKRGFANAVAVLHVSNSQFLAMSLSSLAVWSGDRGMPVVLTVSLFSIAWLLYLGSTTLSWAELNGIAWENKAFVEKRLFPLMPRGPRRRSNLIGNVGDLGRDIDMYTFGPCLITGVLALFQVTCQVSQALFPEIIPAPHYALREFFATLVLFMAAVMDAGFFAWTQLRSPTDRTAIGDIVLTQILPLLANLLTGDWVAAADDRYELSFLKEYFLWTSKSFS